MSNGVRIKYGNIAPEAKENFIPTASESQFDTLSQLQRYNLNFPNYANPCELYSVVLDGTASAFPSSPENANLGLWSEQISNDNGEFEEPIALTLTSEGQYSSQALTFTFDTYNEIFATRLNLKWYRFDELLEDEDFYPDNAVYTCEKKIENYNKIVATFYSINMPKNRLKLRAIDYGYGTWFEAKNLRNVKLIQEINPISAEISINTADFTLDIDVEKDLLFQKKQPLSIYFNGKLRATTFIKNFKRKTKNLWDLKTEDYIGLLDGVPYSGGIYVNANAFALLEDIFRVAKVPFVIDEELKEATVTGHIPYTSCRDALMQVVFAIGAVADTSDSDVVKIFVLSDEATQTIPLSRIMQGQSFDDAETVTGVEVVAHSYTKLDESIDVYKSEENGENVFIKFSEPLHDLTISNDGEIVKSGANYAVINVIEGCILRGKKYEHTKTTKRKNNPLVLANEVEKIISIENATLVSSDNVDKVLNRCYNYLTKTLTVKEKIVEGRHTSPENEITYDEAVNVGDVIITETEILGDVSGRVIKETFNLVGGIIVKDCVIR